jgi:hypothetical protein
MKKVLFSQLYLLFVIQLHSQSDTIYSNNKKISCSIQEITLEAVKYSRTGETLVNSIHKNMVQKIMFKSGREEVFTSTLSLQAIIGANDYSKVSISESESEVAGLYKIGLVTTKARGTTFLSNQNRVKRRAYKKLKILAAMQGANTIYLTHEHSRGNNLMGNSSSNLTGIAYSNTLPDFESFQKMISNNKGFWAVRTSELSNSASDMIQTDVGLQFTIDRLVNENGIVMIQGHLYGELHEFRFRVVSFGEGFFTVFYATAEKSIEVKIKILD